MNPNFSSPRPPDERIPAPNRRSNFRPHIVRRRFQRRAEPNPDVGSDSHRAPTLSSAA